MNLLPLLAIGADRAVSISELAETLAVPRRLVERELEQMACSGKYPVVAGPKGVYLAQSDSEILEYIASLEHRMAAIRERVRGLQRCRSQRLYQATLWSDVA